MAEASPIVEVSAQNFEAEVVERSTSTPVFVLLWTPQIPEAAEMYRTLERLAKQYLGKFLLAHCDVARDRAIAQSLRIQSVPSIRVVHNGQIVDQLDGGQSEETLRTLIDRLTQSDSERLQHALKDVIEREDWKRAIQILKQALAEEPNNSSYRVEWADVLAMRGDISGAQQVVDSIKAGTPDLVRPQTRIEIAQEARAMGSLKDSLRSVELDGSDLEARYRCTILFADLRRYREALDQALQILSADRSFRDDIGRLVMIRIMQLMPKDSPIAQEFRQEMFNIMH